MEIAEGLGSFLFILYSQAKEEPNVENSSHETTNLLYLGGDESVP